MSLESRCKASIPTDYEAMQGDVAEDAVQSASKSNSLSLELPPQAELSWKPSYLRRRILGSFIAGFLFLIAIIITLSQISYRNHGLATSFTGLHYLWTYGPTAILTLVGASWARVSFQAKLIAPWSQLHKKPVDVERALLLDYMSMFSPLAAFRSFQGRDFLVTTTSMVSLIFSILIVLSTGLITLSPTSVTVENAPIILHTAFTTNSTKLRKPDSLPWLVMAGLIKGELKNPDGVTERLAYQTFNASLAATAELQATVDGLSADLDCEKASLGRVPFFDGYSTFNMTLSTPTCTVEAQISDLLLNGSDVWDSPLFNRGYTSQLFLGSCGGSAKIRDQRVIIFFGLLQLNPYFGHNYSWESVFFNVTVLQSTQLICKPTYSMMPVNVIKNGSQIQNVALSGHNISRSSDGIDGWGIARGYFDSHVSRISLNQNINQLESALSVCGESLCVDDQTNMALSDPSKLKCPIDLLLQSEYLEKYMTAHYQKYTAVLAHLTVLEPASINSTGTAVLVENRLLIRAFAAQS
ncbi:hypothetical protein F5Y03DRAFT_168928 [Xylaria venustula]|nr:hypothetical protein F5Y03DRAFT_168928 [Xylaria venustula]